MVEIEAGQLSGAITGRKHGLVPEQVESIGKLTNDELLSFRIDDPISAFEFAGGLSLTGGHHRTAEIIKRVASGSLEPNTKVRILVHD